MRLLHVRDFTFCSFSGREIPRYVILSHRWIGQETTLQTFEREKHLSTEEPCSSGVGKIKKFCEAVAHAPEGCEWCWVDTCCIDKTSSAELSEAINSMWAWYRKAVACYVYLHDVEAVVTDPCSVLDAFRAALAQSDWFSRGWTLQELLAPIKLVFLDARWNRIGSRDEPGLRKVVADVAGIKSCYFGNLEEVGAACVAERMRWVSKRATTRIEDLAYCMLGIFNVNMPLLYGEGYRAFVRLQLEIIKMTDDETIFAWVNPRLQVSGLLAEHPSSFAEIAADEIHRQECIDRAPFMMTPKGLELEIYASSYEKRDVKLNIPLNCYVKNKGWVMITLSRFDASTWFRTDLGVLKTQEIVADDQNGDSLPDLLSWMHWQGRDLRRKDQSLTEEAVRELQDRRVDHLKKKSKIYVRQYRSFPRISRL